MESVITIITGLIEEILHILNESSPWVLLGFTVAALVKAFVPDDLVTKHLGSDGMMSVFKAALFGVPIPLCSCGVVPAAMGLRKQGASRGATTSFLISTPETGVDSIAITWALMDPLMTVFRPVAAFLTALAAGFIENLSSKKSNSNHEPEPEPENDNCCANENCATKSSSEQKPSFNIRLKDSFEYAFGDLLADIGKWLLVGIVLAGIISYLIPDDFFQNNLGSGIVPMLIMLAIGLPLYVCASSSTPVAAALVLKGLSPGAALVFLLVGPATNAATMTVVAKLMGRRSLVIYLITIAVFALGLGIALDFLYGALGVSLIPRIGEAGEHGVGWFAVMCSVLMIFLIGRSIWLERLEKKEE